MLARYDIIFVLVHNITKPRFVCIIEMLLVVLINIILIEIFFDLSIGYVLSGEQYIF